MEVYSSAIQGTLTHVIESFQYCTPYSSKHCVLILHYVKSKYYHYRAEANSQIAI